MALQVFVSPFLGVLFDNLTSPISQEVDLLWGVDNELKRFITTVSSIQAVLEDVDNKQLSSKDISRWLLKLKDAAYDADDIRDGWTTQASRTQQVNGSDLLSCFSFDQAKFGHKIRKRMKKLNQRFDDIASQSYKFRFREGVLERRAESYHNRIASSVLSEYGREKDTSYIVGWLLSNTDSVKEFCLFLILGMGGIGKINDAQSLYRGKKVNKHFNLKIWVCVSNEFDLTKLTKADLDSLWGRSCNSEQLDPLQHRLQEKLSGERFLIVLDDVWNENQREWDRFKFSLQCGAKGSSVIVTTRLQTVASITGTCHPDSLKCLYEEDCFALFKRCTFDTGNEERQALVKIGKEIVEKGEVCHWLQKFWGA